MAGEQVQCPIWGSSAVLHETQDYGERNVFHSPRTGGKFTLVGSAGKISSLSDDQKARITTYIIDQRRFGISAPIIDRFVVERYKDAPPLTPRRRCDRFLQYLLEHTTNLGGGVYIHNNNQDETGAALAWTESHLIDDLGFIQRYLHKQGLIEIDGNSFFRLTVSGYERLEQLDRNARSSAQAFIAMWFNECMNQAYESGIEMAVRAAGYEPVRIDNTEHANKICDQIIAEIRRSRFVVADFTAEPEKPRGGVYFEAGFAQGLNVPVIWTCRDNVKDYIHFDTRQFNHIFWNTPQELQERLKTRIEAVVGEGPLKPRLTYPARTA
ncbi:MAG: hypothetical protein JNM48_08900 [Rhodospirillales bacterium]|nr:hypothetical protein [Rhodospirillales bacterium]